MSDVENDEVLVDYAQLLGKKRYGSRIEIVMLVNAVNTAKNQSEVKRQIYQISWIRSSSSSLVRPCLNASRKK